MLLHGVSASGGSTRQLKSVTITEEGREPTVALTTGRHKLSLSAPILPMPTLTHHQILFRVGSERRCLHLRLPRRLLQ